MMGLLFVCATTGLLYSSVGNDSGLVRLQNLASEMEKARKDLPDSAYIEYAEVSQVHGCSGPARNALRHRISQKGLIESWDYRSPAEGAEPIGYYRGKAHDTLWNSLLRDLAKSKGAKSRSGISSMPPPGPSEIITVLSISTGRKTASYSKTGAIQESLEGVFNQMEVLGQKGVDTIWKLSLLNPQVSIHKKHIKVTSEWKWRGPAGAQILFSSSAGGQFCGTAAFKWFLDTSDNTVEWHRETIGKSEPISWELPGRGRNSISLTFPSEGSKGKSKKVGLIDGIGIRLVLSGSRDTISATLFTDRFEF